MRLANLEKDKYYRNCLSVNLGRRIKLECSDFKLVTRNDGEKFILLNTPKITKIFYKRGKQKYPIIVSHLWVKPTNNISWLPIARKIVVYGRIIEYPYSEKGTKQIGVSADSIDVLKYKKDIAKKYHLRPNDKLSEGLTEELVGEYTRG